jgi:hypothetical protein
MVTLDCVKLLDVRFAGVVGACESRVVTFRAELEVETFCAASLALTVIEYVVEADKPEIPMEVPVTLLMNPPLRYTS